MTAQTEATSPPSGGAAYGPAEAAPAPDRLPRESFVVIALLMASAFTVILNETTMGVALPPIMDDLNITATTGQWLTTAFMLTMAVVIPATGFIINRLGTRGAYLLAMSLFSLGTLLALLAPGFAFLVVGRVVQATGTAIMMPLLMTTIMTIVPHHMRGRVMGNITLVIAAAPALGPTLSGAVLGPLGWRGVFGVVLPISLLALLAGVLWIRDVADRDRHPLDPLSLLLALLAFGGLVYGLSALGESARGGAPVHPAVPLLLGVAVLGLFVWRQLVRQRTDSALLDLRVFRARSFSLAIGILAVSMIAMFGAFILLPLVLQEALGLPPLYSGLLLLPGGLAMGLLGPTIGKLYDRVGPRPIMLPAVVGVTLAVTAFAFITPTTSPFYVLGAHVLLSLGLSGIFTPLFTAGLGDLEPHLYSHGSAIINTVQQVAGAAGTALFVALMTVRSVALADAGQPAADALTGGSQLAFLVAAVVMLGAVALTFMMRKPVNAPAEGGPGH
ncbi:DHA2 family efflux MFS transporter permease subunit [Antribacter sp. KLBMP9083]|uniref:DHA2 family efflux MFS transporter permease subunit n=1 Tax=Antribacter soli TaxID=2910976 RepID=A0AA41QCS8_9MICO|nr:DHA2 family efflux MFS transporter permease subunit [Antribacter soli]MCF4120425.1 DHA2 family efflux MFS transporter permease subunit [Antribacter soli]